MANHLLDPPVFLAPMAGITDAPFRGLVALFGAGLVVSEMVASEDVVRARRDARRRAEPCRGGRPSAVQLVGRDARWMAEAARVVADEGADIVDINMGCPARKVTGGLSGSALLRDLDHALRLVEAVAGAVDVPVTLKTRLGWDAERAAPELARRAEAAGVRMIVVHGRTRSQFFRGRADWAAIRAVKDAVSIPVVANGDVRDAGDAREALRLSGADGVMVGRGCQGRPWRVAEIAAALAGAPAPDVPRGPALADLVSAHFEASLSFYGRELGARVVRKHLAWYMDAAATPRALRARVLTERDPDAARRLVRDAVQAAA